MIPPDIAATMREALTEVRHDAQRYASIYGDNAGELARIDAALQYLDTLPAAPAPDTREALAEYAHEAWSGWMKYLFSKGTFDAVETEPGLGEQVWIMPSWAVARWARQMSTPYADLPEEEKESDRAEADKMLAIVERTTLVARPTE